MPIVDEMRQAGFSDEAIGAWAEKERPAMREAGFDDTTIESYFSGLKNPGGVPLPLLDRIQSGIGRIGAGIKEGAEAGFGDKPIGLTPQDKKTLGLPDDSKVQVSKIYAATEVMFRGLNAALMGGGAGVGQTISEVPGAGEAESARARRDWAGMVSIAAILLGSDAPMTRAPYTAGKIDDVVGRLPQPVDFTNATKVVSGGDVPPLARQKIVQLYEDHGIHPAEIAA